MRAGWTVLVAAVVFAFVGGGGASAAPSTPTFAAGPVAAAVPVARHVVSIPAVGPLFIPGVLGLAPRLGLPHYCSGSVVHSASRDLVLTAAHCVYGIGVGIEFAPGFHDGVAPYGVWDVTRAYLDPAWVSTHDPTRDVAVLVLAPHGSTRVEDRAGGYRLGSAPVPGTQVTVDGYPFGSGGTPVTCTAPVTRTAGYPTFGCSGFTDGVSGGPWLAGGRIVGVTGGLRQGGCTDSTSYSAPFGDAEQALLTRAERGGPGNLAPLPSPAGC